MKKLSINCEISETGDNIAECLGLTEKEVLDIGARVRDIIVSCRNFGDTFRKLIDTFKNEEFVIAVGAMFELLVRADMKIAEEDMKDILKAIIVIPPSENSGGQSTPPIYH